MYACKRICSLTSVTVTVLAVAGCGGSGGGRSTAASQTTGTTSSSPASSTAAPASTAAAASPPSTAPSGGETVVGSASGVVATMHAGTHSPRVGQPWPVRFTVTRGGSGVVASVGYEFLFGGQVVARRSHYTFRGHFSDIVEWPASAVGYPLTLRTVVRAAGATINLDYPVQVVK